MQNDIQALKETLNQPTDIAILTHRNPDGDAMGSSLAMKHYLEQQFHRVQIVLPSLYPAFFEWMPGINESLVFDDDPKDCKRVLKGAKVIFCLDFNGLDRIDKLGDALRQIKADKRNALTIVMIDHHLNPSNFADHIFSNPDASSTCEMVYKFINDMGDSQLINPTVGSCIYTGIVTDTGSFRYSCNPYLFRVVAELLERGVDDTSIQTKIYANQSERTLRLLGHALSDRLEVMDDLPVGIIYLNKKDYETYDIQRGDTEGIVNYILSMNKVKVAAFITQQPNIVKFSFRSKGDFSVEEVAKKYFNGGGHRNASGGYMHGTINTAIKKFKKVIHQYKDELV